MAKGKLKPISQEDLQKAVAYEIEEALDFISSEISGKRIIADLYYQGKTRLKHEAGRSSIVVSKVRDTIKGVLPSIGRVFTQTDKVCEFSSDDEEDEKMCQQATMFCNSVFAKYEGYKAMVEATTDAMKSRIGVVRVNFNRVEVASHRMTAAMTGEELASIEESEDAEVTEEGEEVLGDDGVPRKSVVITRKVMRNKWEILAIPPEDFFIDSGATCLYDARIFGIARDIRIYEAMEMGYDFEDLKDLAAAEGMQTSEQERIYRLGYDRDQDTAWAKDPTSREILICEAWMRIDADGDGHAELRHIVTGGLQFEILDDEPVQYPPLAIFKTDLQPHVFFPISLAEDTMQDQDAMTAILRSIIDNVALVNAPRTVLNENMVNVEDAKNNEIGSIIRARSMGQIEELATPFVAGQTLPVLQYINDNSEARSGVTKLSQGLDPDALQSTSRIAANAAVMGGDARIEFMARNIAETGMKELFICLLRTAMYNMKGKQSIKTEDEYKSVQPDTWHDQVNVIANVGMGSGRIDEKKQTLQQLAAVQQQIVMTLGLANPICGWQQLRTTYRDVLRLSGIKSIGQYFPPVPPNVLAQLDKQQQQQKQQAEGGAQDAQAFVQAEKYKADVRAQTETQKMQMKHQSDIAKLQLDIKKLQVEQAADMSVELMRDDRERDKQAQDYAVESARVESDERVNINQVAVKAETERSRPMPERIGVNGATR